jgi:dimethylargininase
LPGSAQINGLNRPEAKNNMFSKAIVRPPSRSLIDGLTTAGLGIPDHPLALAQHTAYVAALEDCGLEIIHLPADE